MALHHREYQINWSDCLSPATICIYILVVHFSRPLCPLCEKKHKHFVFFVVCFLLYFLPYWIHVSPYCALTVTVRILASEPMLNVYIFNCPFFFFHLYPKCNTPWPQNRGTLNHEVCTLLNHQYAVSGLNDVRKDRTMEWMTYHLREVYVACSPLHRSHGRE